VRAWGSATASGISMASLSTMQIGHNHSPTGTRVRIGDVHFKWNDRGQLSHMIRSPSSSQAKQVSEFASLELQRFLGWFDSESSDDAILRVDRGGRDFLLFDRLRRAAFFRAMTWQRHSPKKDFLPSYKILAPRNVKVYICEHHIQTCQSNRHIAGRQTICFIRNH